MSDYTTRRTFLRHAAAVLGGVLAGATGACRRGGNPGESAGDAAGSVAADSMSTAGLARSVRPIGIQLYTLRTLMQRDVEGTLAAVGDIGYREVEFHSYFGRDPRQLRETLDRLRLTAPAKHASLEELRTNLAGILDAARVLGHRYIVCPWIGERERTLDGYRRLAGEFNRWGAACRERGLRFAYHNHEFEFIPTGGRVPLDVLLSETDPALVWVELDLFWITKAGRDPLDYFARYRGRFPLWHVKDMRDIRGTQEMTAVGEGEIGFDRIFARAEEAGLEHFFVEHDQPADPLQSARTSFHNLRRLLS